MNKDPLAEPQPGVASGRDRTYIAVIGGESCPADVEQLAEEVGHELGRRGAVVVCGGRGGVMAAACRGAKAAGGTTVGILPGEGENGRREANPHVDVALTSGFGYARNVLVVRAAQAVIAIGGRYGTLSEIALALNFSIPVIGLQTWHLSPEGALEDAMIVRASDARDAVDKALAAAYSPNRRDRRGRAP
ncbi:MAG: TIGR00725 family protein [Chloroflexi bacterium]|nr:TIGR00725 family protein [Chloroflexota bacterium]